MAFNAIGFRLKIFVALMIAVMITGTPQWLNYMRYLKNSYPYLFSLAARMNPFNLQRSPVVMS